MPMERLTHYHLARDRISWIHQELSYICSVLQGRNELSKNGRVYKKINGVLKNIKPVSDEFNTNTSKAQFRKT